MVSSYVPFFAGSPYSLSDLKGRVEDPIVGGGNLCSVVGVAPVLILLANPSQWLPCGRHGERTEADLMEEPSSSFFTLQFTLNEIALLDR
ncbi:MAG TPA: hypothetical protein VGN34_32740, partial [Ktedonobacteraceae bacterium]